MGSMSGGEEQKGDSGGLSSWGPATPQPKSFLRRFRWLLIAGGILVLLLFLVVLAPTLASMGWAKSIILGKVNDQLNGTLVANEWDLNWFGGLELSGVRLYDKNKVQLLEMKRLKTELSVWDVIFGDMYNLGKTKVEGLALTFEQYKDGSTNFTNLVKPTPGAKQNGDTKTPFKMPDLKGDFDIDFRATLVQESEKGKQQIEVDRSSIKLKVPNINSQLANQVDIEFRTFDQKQGKLTANGSVKLFDKFIFDSERFSADENIEIQNAPLISALPFVDAKQINKLEGIASSKLQVKMAGVDDVTVEGNTSIDDLAVGGPALQGDTFAAKKFIVEIPKTSFAKGNGRIKTGESAASMPIAIRFDDNSILLVVDAPIGSLQNLAKNEKPGADGQVAATIDLKVAALASQLPHMLDLPEGVKIESGSLKQNLNLTLAPDKAVIKQVLDLADLRGTRQGKAIAAQPIHLTFEGTSLGGGGTVPDVRNFVIGLASGFATINGNGESLAKHHVDGTMDLAKAKEELGQFSGFFAKADLAGNLQFKLDTVGDLLSGQNPQMEASLTGNDLKIANVLAHPINEKWVAANAKGNLVFQDTVLKSIRGASATIKTNNPQKPSADLVVAGDVNLAPFAVPNFQVRESKIDLAALQKEFAAFIPPTKVKFESGIIVLAAAGRMDENGASLTSLKVNPQNLTVVQNQKPVLENYTGTLEMVGDVQQAGKAVNAKISKLSLSDQKNLLTIEKGGDGDLVFNLAPDGSFTGSGKLAIKNADLKALTDIAQAAGAKEPPPPNEPQLKSGNLSGTIELVRSNADQTAVISDLRASKLTISEPQNLFRDQDVSISIRANANKDFSLLDLGQLDVRSSFMNLLLSDTVVRRPVGGAAVSPLDMIEKARMVMDVPNLPRAQALVMAFIPAGAQKQEKALPDKPAAQPARQTDIGSERISSGPQRQPARPAPETATKTDEPLKIADGSAKGTVVVSRQDKALKVEVQDLTAKALKLVRGRGTPWQKDILFNLAVLVQPSANADPAKPTSEQIQDVQITKLDGSLGIVDLHLEEPIVLKNLTSNMEASGAIRATGDIDPLSDFLEVMGFVDPGQLKDYHGSYVVTQKVGTKQDTLAASGQISITDLKIGSTVRPQFSERLLAINNEISLDQKAKAITINNLSLNMQDSKALEVVVKNGKIEDYEKSRKFDDLKMLLSYDAAKVWAIVKPMLSVEQQKNFEDMRVAGVVKDREFSITGSYPAETKKDKKGQQISPLEYVTVQGSVYLNQFEYQGMEAQELELPLYFNKGVVQTIYKNKPDAQYAKPAKYSGGTIDLSGLSIDVLADHPRVTALRKNYALLENVEIKREFVDAYLGKASPWFTGAEDARGRITVMVKELDRLPLDEALTKPTRKDIGKGSVTFSITDLRLKNFMIRLLGDQLSMKLNSDGTLSADIKDAVVSVESGKVTSDITLNLGGQNIGNRGTVRMRDEHIEDMLMLLPREMIPKALLFGIDPKMISEVVEVPLTGNMRKPQLDIAGAVKKSFTPLKGIDNLLNPKSKPPGIIGQPAK